MSTRTAKLASQVRDRVIYDLEMMFLEEVRRALNSGDFGEVMFETLHILMNAIAIRERDDTYKPASNRCLEIISGLREESVHSLIARETKKHKDLEKRVEKLLGTSGEKRTAFVYDDSLSLAGFVGPLFEDEFERDDRRAYEEMYGVVAAFSHTLARFSSSIPSI